MKSDKACFILMSLMIFLSSLVFSKDIKSVSTNQFENWKKITEKMTTDTAILFYRDKLELNSLSDPAGETEFHLRISLGTLYRLKAEFTKALELDLAAMLIAEKTNSPALLGIACNSLGIDYYRTEDFNNAEKYFRLSISYNEVSGDNTLRANSFYKLAMVLDDTNRQTEAMQFFNKALEIYENENDCIGSADVYNGMAALYYKKNKPDSTEYYGLLAMKNYKDCGSLETVCFMLMNLASLKNMQKEHKQALNYLNQGLYLADSLNLLSQLRQGYKNLSETYAYMGDFENAYNNHLKYNIYKDSIFNTENSTTFLELNTKYETEKKERQLVEKQSQIDLQNAEIQRSAQQRKLLIIIALLTLIIAIILIYRFNEKKKYANLLDNQNQELEKINADKDKLFSIISHDLSSPVAAYTRLTEAVLKSMDKLSTEQLKEYLSNINSSSQNIQMLLSNLLQWSLRQSGHFKPAPEDVNIGQLIANAISSLQTPADEKNIHIKTDYTFDGEIFADPKMIETAIRNILSNAIKFSPENSIVKIQVWKEKEFIFLKIADSGPGLNDNELEKIFMHGEDLTKIGQKNKNKGTGLGLILASEFVKLNKGDIFAEKNEDAGLSIIIKINTT